VAVPGVAVGGPALALVANRAAEFVGRVVLQQITGVSRERLLGLGERWIVDAHMARNTAIDSAKFFQIHLPNFERKLNGLFAGRRRLCVERGRVGGLMLLPLGREVFFKGCQQQEKQADQAGDQ
jgi:hypothetical protein